MSRSLLPAKVVAAAACFATIGAMVVNGAADASQAAPSAPAAPSMSRIALAARSAPVPPGAHRDGAVAGNRQIDVAIALRPHDEAGLNRFVAAVNDPASPAYRHFLTSAEYNDQFAPRQSDVDSVRNFLQANGLAVKGVSGNRQVVNAAGTADQVRAAFGTALSDYTGQDGAHFYANDAAPTAPADVAGLLRTVVGLNSLPFAHRASGPAGPGGPGGGYTPAQFRTAYSMKNLSSSYDGTGQTVGLIEFDGFKQSDIDGWTRNFSQPSVTPQVVKIDNPPSTPGSNQLEVTLDIEAVAATAPKAAQVVYEAANSDSAWVDEMAKIASDNAITILSGSWLNGEKCESEPIQASHDSYNQMAAQGVTLLSASGDWGATGCGYNGDNSTIQADFPPSDPLFTGVGGTQLKTSDSAGTWQSESCWNQGGSGNTRSGGAYSQIFDKPSWQPGTNKYRSVPDVALDADYGAGALSVYMNGGWQDVGGTSLSSPLWAGYIAMVNQKAKAGGKSNLGGINPTLYAIAGSAKYGDNFHDVTSGSNGTYSAGTGYDLCTGWGSMKGDTLADSLINGATPPASNDFTIAATPSSVSVDPGKSVTSTISTTIAKGNAQNISLSASGLPSGVTASFDPTSVTAGNSATLTLTASSSASPGTTNVTITGTGTDATHTATVALTVNGTTTPGDFSISVAPTSATVTAGQSTSATVRTTSTARVASSPGVVGGNPTTVDQYPYMISMRREGSVFPGQQSCSMALMGPHTVLGAAHCLKEKDGTKWFIYGATNLNDSGFRAEIKSTWVDPNYNGWQTGHDVAVFTLDRDVPVPSNIVYPTIATDTGVNKVGTTGTGIGWGQTGANSYSDVLRTVQLPVAADSSCAKQPVLSSNYKSDGSMLCVGYADGHQGVCTGDSGSPFLENNQVVGIFSWDSTQCDTYGVYARVTTYADEIKAQLPTGTPTPPSGSITLTATGLPTGATATFDPTTVDAGGSSNLTISTSSTTPAGTYPVKITGTKGSTTHDTTFTLTVQTGTPAKISVRDPGFQFTQHGTQVNLQLQATGGSGTYRWTATGLPAGLSINATTGLITGKPAAATQIFNVTVTATDASGGSGKDTFSWFVY
ncbi:trypsin-like serine protease [Actinokineospora inagensis]|uniref:trypsin-like serine protease n=1 Tax=Actinokineospora inagensis TaxID=103730 RepID=UPI0003FB28ED|nr:trypsin-like serine protease [Actinokineospora inagensis]